MVVFYQATISYFLGGNCRFYPSCSHYAKEAYGKHSAFDATVLTLKRFLSCHPFSRKAYYDPVPEVTLNYCQRGLCEHTK